MRRRYTDKRAFSGRRRKPVYGAAKAVLVLCAALALILFIGASAESDFIITDGGEKKAALLNTAIDQTLSVTPVFCAHQRALSAYGAGKHASGAYENAGENVSDEALASAETTQSAQGGTNENSGGEGKIMQLSSDEGASPSLALSHEEQPENTYKIEDVTLSPKSDSGYVRFDNIYIINNTKFGIDPQSLISEPLPFSYNENEMQVLIIHTHSTESYSPNGAKYYGENDKTRTLDNEQNVVRVGEEMRRVLESRGINVYHDMTVHDYPSYNGSYTRALETINARLSEYPSIKIVIDVHRDAIIDADNTKYRPVVEYDGVRFAQMLLCMGSSEGGLEHKDWQTNLSFAIKLQKKLCDAVPDLMRPLALKKERYNQHATPGSLLIEVGSDGNSIEEALASSRVFAQALADVLKGE
ncbi:MAG: stage II sporulation protein P [Clostridia bacterium]|nr:stage II sporulation protein P [Clostridia bacterium]